MKTMKEMPLPTQGSKKHLNMLVLEVNVLGLYVLLCEFNHASNLLCVSVAANKWR